MLRLTFKNFWTFFYAFSLTVGIYISLQELHTYNNSSTYLTFSLALLFIFLTEIYITWQTNQLKVAIEISTEVVKYTLVHLVHRVLLPVGLYISLTSYGYYNFTSDSFTVLLVLVFIIFYILFYNIRVYFEHHNKEDHNTHYVYDIIKFLIFYMSLDLYSNLFLTEKISLTVGTILSIVTTYIIVHLMIWRVDKLSKYNSVLTMVASLYVGGVYFILINLEKFNALQIALIASLSFYFLVAIISHRIHHTLSKDVIVEYLLIFVIVFGIMYGLN